jgi:hypothetical protein
MMKSRRLMRNLGISPLSRRLVYHTLSLPHASQQVLGPDLNRSESERGWTAHMAGQVNLGLSMMPKLEIAAR